MNLEKNFFLKLDNYEHKHKLMVLSNLVETFISIANNGIASKKIKD